MSDKVVFEVENFMKQILHHSKSYETEKLVFSDIETIIKLRYQEIIGNHIKMIYGKPLYAENLEILKDTIIKQLDLKLKKKEIKPKQPKEPKAKQPKEPKPKLTKEEKEAKKKAMLEKKKAMEEKINENKLKKSKKSFTIPILVETNDI